MNAKIFDEKDYKLDFVVRQIPGGEWMYSFRFVFDGMSFTSDKKYSTKGKAMDAGRSWLEKNLHASGSICR